MTRCADSASQSFVLSTLPYTALLPPLLLALVLRPLTFGRANYLPAGPTAIVFALLAQYHAAVPYEYKYRVATSPLASASPGLTTTAASTTGNSNTSASNPSTRTTGLTLTSKTLSYIPALQLALAQLPGSLLAAAAGWAVGLAYRHDALPGAGAWRVPAWVVGERRARGAREGFEGLRRRMEDQAGGSGSGREEGEGGGRRRARRTLGGVLGSMVGGGGA